MIVERVCQELNVLWWTVLQMPLSQCVCVETIQGAATDKCYYEKDGCGGRRDTEDHILN